MNTSIREYTITKYLRHKKGCSCIGGSLCWCDNPGEQMPKCVAEIEKDLDEECTTE